MRGALVSLHDSIEMSAQYTTIVLHIEAARADEFERLFEQHELPRWEDYVARGRFLNCRLVRCDFSHLQHEGIQDYVLQVVTADEEAHHEHDADPGFKEYDQLADAFQPEEPTVTFGRLVFER